MTDIDTRRNLRVAVADGTELSADAFIPTSATPCPVILNFDPYRGTGRISLEPWALEFVEGGYAFVFVDVRGSGGSEGIVIDDFTVQEQRDAADAVEWFATQEWCSGAVVVWGGSYGGMAALQTAALAPPHLRAIVPIACSDDRYTDHYCGGLLRMYFDAGYYANAMVASNALPPVAETASARWAELWDTHLSSNAPYQLNWLREQTDGPYWRAGSVTEVADQIKCPVFYIGGWRDSSPNQSLHLYERLEVPTRVLMGPWNHGLPDTAIVGPRIDWHREVLAWLDRWCRDGSADADSRAPIQVFMQRTQRLPPDDYEIAGEWRAEAAWPPPGGTERTLHLGAHGSLSDEAVPTPARDGFEYDPSVGVCGGLWSGIGGFPDLPIDQRADEALSLVYSSSPLAEDLHILGRPRALLHVDSSASVIAFCVSLSEVSPDGRSQLVTKGVLNATRRGSLTKPEALEPGKLYELAIELDTTGWIFTAGNRIRVSIASADFPNMWPTPEPAHNSVHYGGATPSRIVLPVVPLTGSAPAPDLRPSPRKPAAARDDGWEIVHDVLTQRVTVRSHAGSMKSTAWVERSNPGNALSRGQQTTSIEAAGQKITAQSQTTISSTATHFHTTIQLEVRVNGQLHYNRHWTESVQRHLL